MEAVKFSEDKIILIDQTKLPLKEEFIVTDDYERIALAIERLEVRGAPAIGVTAAYALALSIKNKTKNLTEEFFKAYERLKATRPTAVNLFFGLESIRNVFENYKNDQQVYTKLIEAAKRIHQDDIEMCEKIALNGMTVFNKKLKVLTHCNTGALATGGSGTALNVIRHAYLNGLIEHVYVDETRPLLQGSRLTAWELDQLGIPFSINTDSTAAVLMKEKRVDLVITGADRIAVNGDTANKIGTYNLAVLARHHNVPFYIAAPSSTIDRNCPTGNEIKIELRSKDELVKIGDCRFTSDAYDAYCPAFDVTPAELIAGIITEEGVFRKPYRFENV
ncbi:S-methyl-5-thioribose-1-phosphate isomerase [Melioribacter sp. OK-6-Me]|uniref:S-methyl-5-thioribose-1-phosphate isomerase n=1 Tax=unclassified Melioribacter TaxID=2627329 RepID=UPI003EDA2409